ncbi:unnamed protein product [Orchesella dallaii]|uniref:Uncharacterized protein n=1 Tax=Orchesella dallaii TaxID=48710 RepID=A0ABP1S4M4_9HEXA
MMEKTRKLISMNATSVFNSVVVLIFLSAVISRTSSAKLSRSNHHESRDASPDSSLETLLFRDKLSLILDAESREVTLLKKLLDESHEAAGENALEAMDVDDVSSREKNELDNSYKSQSDSWATDTSSPARPTRKTATWSSTTMSTMTTTTLSPLDSEKFGNNAGETTTTAHSLAYLREHGIVSKLEENSKRMEKMVVFLVDLRNLLTEALTTQTRQMAFESEMVEIREEMEYLRKELQSLKKEKSMLLLSTSSSSSFSSPNNVNLENKLHNDEATIQWLKDSTTELRSQMKEISESCNMTIMVQMKEQMDKENGRRDGDLAAVGKEMETLRLKQLRQDEQLSEAKANIEDLRSWQVKMGQKLIDNKSTSTTAASGGQGTSNNSLLDESEEASNSVEFGMEEHFITEALKESVGKPLRHKKRLKAKVHELQTIVQDLVKDNKNYGRRLMKIENSQRSLKSMTNNLRETLLASSGLISTTTGNGNSHNDVFHRSGSNGNVNTNNGNGGRVTRRMESLEKTMQEYVITLENLNDKVGAVEELQESSTQLFRALETLETKYDERVTELQTGLARLESSVSSVLVVNEDVKEQQTQQSSLIQGVKKDLFQMKGKLQTNHLRLASIQSQMVKWASQKCSDENSESIQNIRIATLEHALLDLRRTPSSTSTDFS